MQQDRGRRPLVVGDICVFRRGATHHVYRVTGPRTGETACRMAVDADVVGGGTLHTEARYGAQPSCVRCLRALDEVATRRRQMALFGEVREDRGRPPDPAPAPSRPDRPRPLLFAAAPAGMMLQEAVDALERDIARGTRCPCCQRPAKMHKRPINATMARLLIGLVRVWQTGAPWVAVADVPFGRRDARVAGGELAKLRWWGLVEEKGIGEPVPDDGPEDARSRRDAEQARTRSGLWRPTAAGIDFAYGRSTVDQFVLLWDNRLHGRLGPEVGIQKVLGDRFDVRELALIEVEAERARARR